MALTEEGLVEVPGMLSRWVRLPSGVKAHYMTSGETGPAVVLLHGGLPGSSGTAGWRFLAPYLGEHGFRVYCPDMPGFGLTDPSPYTGGYGLHTYVDFIEEFVTTLGLDRFHLSGNSMGSINTINYTLAHPERVLSFILIAGEVGDIAPIDKRPATNVELTKYDWTREGMRQLMQGIIYRGETITDDLLDMRYNAAITHREAHQQFFPNILQYGGLMPWADANIGVRLRTSGRLDKVTIPGLYLYGRQDALTPVEWGYVQEDVLPNIQFFYPDECGHQGQTDRPDLFNPVYLEFFRDGQVGRKSADAAGVSTRRPEFPDLVAAD